MDTPPPLRSDESDKITPLRAVRLAAGQKLEDVAAAIGIDVGTLSRIERGEPTSATTAAKIANHFGRGLIDELRILYPERYQ